MVAPPILPKAKACTFNANLCGAGPERLGDNLGMKTARKFKGSWFAFAIVAAILVGEVVAWEISTHFGIRNNPLVIAFLSAGLVAAIASVLYEGADIG